MADHDQQSDIDALLEEHRLFVPSDEFRKNANVNDENIWEKAAQDRERFGHGGPGSSTGTRGGTASWSGIRRTRSGSSAERSTRRTTASTAISRRAATSSR